MAFVCDWQVLLANNVSLFDVCMSSEQESTSPEHTVTALVVDDVVQNIEVLGIMLREHHIKVIGATSAPQALRILETTEPDVILLDIQMPEMDGFTACQLIKENPATRHIPVIFLTARTDTADMLRGFSLGAVDFVNKPFQAAELVARVRAHVELKQLRDAVVQQNKQLQTVNNELHTANERLRTLDQEKNEFLGIVAHDLRNPLSGIILAADMMEQLQDKMSEEQKQKKLQGIRTSSLYMREIVSHLLDINLIESGQLSLSPIVFNMIPKVEEIVQSYQERAEAKNIRIVFDALSEKAMAYADAVKTSEVIENIISNAIKYSPPEKTVWVSVKSVLNGDAAPKAVSVGIRDEGPGFTESDKQRLFGKFARLSARPTGGEHSTGLGLSIVKRLVEAMHGQVWCESEHGKGALFMVELPSAEQS
jgi:signal transduction histidine kinase